MRHDPRWLPVLTLLVSAPAHALTWGPTGAAGVFITPGRTTDDVTIQPMFGPVVQLGLETGRVTTNQIMVQFTTAVSGGGVDYDGLPLEGQVSLRTLALGDELHWDIFGKKGKAHLSPQLGFGFLAGNAHVDANVSSTDEAIQNELVTQKLDDKSLDTFYLEFHAMAGLRYRVNKNLGVHVETGLSTYGGYLGTWMPKIGVDYLIPKPTKDAQNQKK